MIVLTTYTDDNGSKHYITGRYDHSLKIVKTYSLFESNKKIKHGNKNRKSSKQKKQI